MSEALQPPPSPSAIRDELQQAVINDLLGPAAGPDEEMSEPEYVNIFGVPFTFLPHEEGDGPPPPPEYVGVYKKGDIVGYHRRNSEIAQLETALTAAG